MRVARIDGEVWYGVSGDPGGPVNITPRLQPGGYTLADAFRAAKLLAGWEVPVHVGFQVVGEPVCRNERGTR